MASLLLLLLLLLLFMGIKINYYTVMLSRTFKNKKIFTECFHYDVIAHYLYTRVLYLLYYLHYLLYSTICIVSLYLRLPLCTYTNVPNLPDKCERTLTFPRCRSWRWTLHLKPVPTLLGQRVRYPSLSFHWKSCPDSLTFFSKALFSNRHRY